MELQGKPREGAVDERACVNEWEERDSLYDLPEQLQQLDCALLQCRETVIVVHLCGCMPPSDSVSLSACHEYQLVPQHL